MILLISSIFLIGCRKEEKKDEYKFIEYIKVEGICGEDHAKTQGKYSGEIVHWYNVTKDTHSRYGFVSHWSSIEERFSNAKDPYKYTLPFTIEFHNLRPEDLVGDELHLKGISSRTDSDKENRATCVLKVIERLDYLPSLKEKEEQLKQ